MGPPQQKTVAQALASANEAAWIQLGELNYMSGTAARNA
jgi:hypothetical protein